MGVGLLMGMVNVNRILKLSDSLPIESRVKEAIARAFTRNRADMSAVMQIMRPIDLGLFDPAYDDTNHELELQTNLFGLIFYIPIAQDFAENGDIQFSSLPEVCGVVDGGGHISGYISTDNALDYGLSLDEQITH